MLGLQSACPQCGAPLRFAGGYSLVSVCEFCRSTIARQGASVHTLGKMPDLVTTDTRLALGCSGAIGSHGFSILGRLQLQQGQAAWDEWYIGWSDGSFGWLAEAQGRVIVTRLYAGAAFAIPRFERLAPGQALALGRMGEAVVEEIGHGRLVSASGELPFQPSFEGNYRFVDATLPDAGWVTIDYGREGEDVQVFVGRQMSHAEAQLRMPAVDRQFREKQLRGEALSCPSCGAPLALKTDAKSVVCDSCHGLCQVEGAKLELLAALQQRFRPALALGAQGELEGKKFEVIGWLKRGVQLEGVEYTWNEYLLHGEPGYRWLSENNGHWIYLKPIAGAALSSIERGDTLRLRDRDYKHFQTSSGVRYLDIQGEFYWQIDPNDTVVLEDYVCPPYLISVEVSQREAQWSAGQYLAGAEVWKIFKPGGSPPAVEGVGPCQTNPYAEIARSIGRRSGYALAALLLVAAGIGACLPRKAALRLDVPLAVDQPVTISQPFDIENGIHATEIAAQAGVGPGDVWIGLDVTLINDTTGASDSVQLELSHFSGFEDGSHWVEDKSNTRERIGSITPGRYVLRIEPQVENRMNAPDFVRVDVTHGAFLWFPFWCALLAFVIPPLYVWTRSYGFEVRRWAESDHPKVQSSSSDDD